MIKFHILIKIGKTSMKKRKNFKATGQAVYDHYCISSKLVAHENGNR